mgnify:CR=1 FL=1
MLPDLNYQIIGNVTLLPLKTTCKCQSAKRVAHVCNDNAFEIVDESLDLLKTNCSWLTKSNRICFWSTTFCTSNYVCKNWPKFPIKRKRNGRFLRKPSSNLRCLETQISPWTPFFTNPKMLRRELNFAITWLKWDKRWEVVWWKKSLGWVWMASLPNGGFASLVTAANSWKLNWLSEVLFYKKKPNVIIFW